MISKIRKILKEVLEIQEKGIEISRLKKLQPRNYLAKRVKSIEKETEKFPKIAEIESKFLSIIDFIKNMDWSELILKENSGAHSFDVKFPKKIEKELNSIYKKVNKLDTNIVNRFDQRLKNFYYDGSDFERNPPTINYEEGRNRTHFPDGLESWLKGLGLGLKIYRKILNQLGHIVSEENASSSVQKIYTDLIQFRDVNCVLIKDSTLVIEKRLSKERKQRIVAEFIYEQYYDFNHPKFKLNKTIVFDSSLLSELGKSKVEELIKRLYDFSEKNTARLSWQDDDSFEDYSEYTGEKNDDEEEDN